MKPKSSLKETESVLKAETEAGRKTKGVPKTTRSIRGPYQTEMKANGIKIRFC